VSWQSGSSTDITTRLGSGVLAQGIAQRFVNADGAALRAVLHPPKQMRDPVEARWKAFRNERRSSLPAARSIPQAREIYGTGRSTARSGRRSHSCAVIGILAILVDSTGFWGR
jgi:hypothetical protein